MFEPRPLPPEPLFFPLCYKDSSGDNGALPFMETFLSRRTETHLPPQESLTPSGQVLANDRQPQRFRVQGDDGEKASGPRSPPRYSATRGQSRSLALVLCPDPPGRRPLPLLECPEAQVHSFTYRNNKRIFFSTEYQLASGKKSLQFCSRHKRLLWALICLLCFCSLGSTAL